MTMAGLLQEGPVLAVECGTTGSGPFVPASIVTTGSSPRLDIAPNWLRGQR